MKNLLWFLHKPTDERERGLYKNAYERILSFLALVFVTAMTAFMFAPSDEFKISIGIIEYAVWSIFIISVLIGWSAVRTEEMEEIAPKSKIKLATLLIVIGIIIANFVVVTLMEPTLYLPAGVISMFLVHIVFMVFAWNATKSIMLPFRLLLSVLFPLFTLVFLTSDIKNAIGRVVGSILMTISLYIIFACCMLVTVGAINGMVISPIYISTNHFEPEIKKEDVVYVDMRVKDYAANDYILFIDSEGKPRVGKVLENDNAAIKVDTAAGVMMVEKDDARGKLLLDRSALSWLERVTNFKQYGIKVFTQ